MNIKNTSDVLILVVFFKVHYNMINTCINRNHGYELGLGWERVCTCLLMPCL